MCGPTILDPFRHFRHILSGPSAESWAQHGCRPKSYCDSVISVMEQTTLAPRFIRDVADHRFLRQGAVSLIPAGVRVPSRILRSIGRRGHPPQRNILHSSFCFCDLQEITSLQTTVARSYSKCVALSVMRTMRLDVNGIHVSTIRNLIRWEESE
jgi:hypothetical protein